MIFYLHGDKNYVNWLENLNQAKKFVTDLQGLIDLKATYLNNAVIGYLNINFFSAKNIRVRGILSKAATDILCLDQIKIDSSFPDVQFKVNCYQYPLIRRGRNSKGTGKIIFIKD